MGKEVWRDLIGFETKYEVSNFGQIKTKKSGTIRRLNKDRKGYLYASLW